MNFKIAFRHLLRNKLYAGLNVLGLSLGIASFLIIYFFVQNELSFDRYHSRSEEILRVTETKTMGEINTHAGISAAFASQVIDNIPDVETYTRIESWDKNVVFPGLQDSIARYSNMSVDQGFFDMFDIEMQEGVIPDFDINPNAVIVSEALATRQWQGDAIGKTLKVRGIPFEVVGIFKGFPNNSSLQGDLIFEIEAVNQWRKDSFTEIFMSYFDQLYLTLNENADREAVSAKLTDLFNGLRGTEVEKMILGLQPLTDIHFNFDIKDSYGRKTDKQMIFVFSGVALFILICSFFNYVSMAIAQSLERIREIGVRKVMGASQKRVYLEHLTESFILILLASILAVVLLEIMVPSLEELIERKLADSIKFSAELWTYAALFIVGITSLSVLYPSILSGHSKVSDLLRNSHRSFKSAKWINALSVVQVIVFMTLISVAMASNKQLHFMQNENLGFEKDNILVIGAYVNQLDKHGELLENKLRSIPGVKEITRASSMPGRVMGSMMMKDYDDITFYNFPVGLNYFETMDMDIVEGRSFRSDDKGKQNIILNQSAIKAMGVEDDPIGQTFTTFNRDWVVVGVVNDFHFFSKKQAIGPTFFRLLDENEGSMLVKLDGANTGQTLAGIQSSYSSISDKVLSYEFLDERFDALHKDEKAMITMIQTGTAMAALVAFLGLFGITGFSIKKRMKEMGIRKVLGATFTNIQSTLNRSSFIKLLVAALISVPLIFYWVNQWLDTFAYRIEFPVIWVLGALLLAGVVAISTSFIHSVKAYLVNPVDILKDE